MNERRAPGFMTFCICCVAVFSAAFAATGQPRVSVGFYNVENLYDTIPSRFYDDGDFTPPGRNGWNSGRYNEKITNIARVIGDMGLDVVGLAEVENEGVVRDLVMALEDDYNYIHRTSSDRRGIDLALLYKGDKFFPEKVRQIGSHSTREFLHVRGKLMGDDVNLLLCHQPSRYNDRKYRQRSLERLAEVADSLQVNDRAAKLIVMGDLNCDPGERMFRRVFGRREGSLYPRHMLYAGIGGQFADGFGSYSYDGKWYLFDNILLSASFVYGGGLAFEKGGVFVREYMIVGSGDASFLPYRRGAPKRSFSGGRYEAGYSDHLPVYIILTY